MCIVHICKKVGIEIFSQWPPLPPLLTLPPLPELDPLISKKLRSVGDVNSLRVGGLYNFF